MPYPPQPFTNLNSAVSTTFSSTSENDLPWDDDTSFYYQPPFGLVPPPSLAEDYSRMVATGADIRPSPSAAPHQPGSDTTGACQHQCRRSPQNPAYANAPALGSRSEVHHHAHCQSHCQSQSHNHHNMRTSASMETPTHRDRPSSSRPPSRTPSQVSRHTNESSSSRESLLVCRWEGCDYVGGFSREATLFRHIRSIHLAPRKYICPIGNNCRAFNRKDNLISHIHSVHRLHYQPADLELLQVRDN